MVVQMLPTTAFAVGGTFNAGQLVRSTPPGDTSFSVIVNLGSGATWDDSKYYYVLLKQDNAPRTAEPQGNYTQYYYARINGTGTTTILANNFTIYSNSTYYSDNPFANTLNTEVSVITTQWGDNQAVSDYFVFNNQIQVINSIGDYPITIEKDGNTATINIGAVQYTASISNLPRACF